MRTAGSLPMLVALACLAVPAAAQEDEAPAIAPPTAADLEASREAASRALEVVAVLADPVLEKLGLGAAGVQREVALGEPIPVFQLNVSHLQGLPKGGDLTRLLTRSDEMFYPISIDGEVVSSVTVEKHDDGWTMTAIGQSHLTAKLLQLQRVLKLTGERVVAVNVPAMYQMFLVEASAKAPIFIPVYDVPVLKLLEMQTIGGSELFDKLRTLLEGFQSALREEEEDGGAPPPGEE
jgi:hypothetical protein